MLGHSQEPCNAKKAVKNFYLTTSQLLTIKPEKKRTLYIPNFICMKIYTKYDNQEYVNSESNQWFIIFKKSSFLSML